MAWLALAYIGSLTALLITAFYKTDPFTTQIVKEFTLQNFSDLFDPAYRTVAIRTILVAATVTVIDFLIALPMAFTLAKVVSERARRLLLVLVLMPLWASYLVKAYSWRAMWSTSSRSRVVAPRRARTSAGTGGQASRRPVHLRIPKPGPRRA